MRVNLTEIIKKPFSGEWGTDDTTGDGFPVLRTTNFTNDGIVNYDNVVLRCITKKNISEKLLKKGDILIEKSGGSDKQPVGRVVFFEGEEMKYLFNNFTSLLRVNDSENWNSKYVFYSLYANYLRGGTLPYQNKTTGLHNLKLDSYISNYTIKNISINDQNRIVKQLDLVRSIIELQNDLLNKLDELIKSRFVEMFGDPVLNLPKWDKVPMGNYMSILTDFSANGSYEYLDSNVVMYNEPNYALMVRTIDLERNDFKNDVKYIDEKAYNILSKSKLFGNEIIMNKIGSAGKVYLMPKLSRPASLGRNAFMFRFNSDINIIFLYYLLTSEYGLSEIQQHVRGAVTKTITKDAARSIRIIVPPVELQNQFADFVAQVEKQKATVKKSIEKLETLKKSLMQEYFG